MKMKTGLFELLTMIFAFTTFVIISPALAGPINIKGSGTNDAKVKIDSVEGDHPSVNFLDNAKQKGVVGWYRTEDAMKFLYGTTLASSNGITLKSTGNVGIGTTNPHVKLEVLDEFNQPQVRLSRADSSLYANLRVDEYGNLGITPTGGVLYISNNATSEYGGFHMWDIYDGKHELVNMISIKGHSYINGGNVGIGTTQPAYPLEMASGAHVTTGGVWTDASSRKYKENIRDLTYDEAELALSSLNPAKFNYKIDKDDEYLGFIAEDVPDLVATKDRKGLSPMDIVAVLTKVVQKQQEEIKALKNLLTTKQ